MSAAETTAAVASELQGLVDNATETKLFGWAWNAARPGERVTVELRLKDGAVASAVADRERADLAKAGIGDGRHAFELPLKPAWAQRHAEIVVVARAADGTESPLALRIRRGDMDPSGVLHRVLETTATAHRQLREELTRIAARLPEDGPRDDAMRDLAAGQAALDAKLETLTLWLTRMDERLAALPPAETVPLRHRRLDPWQITLGAALLAVAAGAGLGTAALLMAG